MDPKIDLDNICNLANLKLTREDKKLLEPQMIKIIKWVNKLEELELDTATGALDSYFLPLPFREDKVKSSLPVQEAFEKVDFILTPTTPEPAFLIGEKEDPISMYLLDIFTVTANLAGIPALTIPVGLSQENLPIGIQIMANFFQESCIFKLAFLLEKKVKFDNNELNLQKKEE